MIPAAAAAAAGTTEDSTAGVGAGKIAEDDADDIDEADDDAETADAAGNVAEKEVAGGAREEDAGGRSAPAFDAAEFDAAEATAFAAALSASLARSRGVCACLTPLPPLPLLSGPPSVAPSASASEAAVKVWESEGRLIEGADAGGPG